MVAIDLIYVPKIISIIYFDLIDELLIKSFIKC